MNNTLTHPVESALHIDGLKVTNLGMHIPKETTEEQYNSIIGKMKLMEVSMRWVWGDILAFGEHNYGSTYANALTESDFEYATLRNSKVVCSRIELSRRRDNLSFSHHEEIAKAFEDKADQDNWLDKAETGGKDNNRMSVGELRAAIRQAKATYKGEDNNLPEDRVYARAMESTFALRDYFKSQDIEKWGKEQRGVWVKRLEPIVNAYKLLTD